MWNLYIQACMMGGALRLRHIWSNRRYRFLEGCVPCQSAPRGRENLKTRSCRRDDFVIRSRRQESFSPMIGACRLIRFSTMTIFGLIDYSSATSIRSWRPTIRFFWCIIFLMTQWHVCGIHRWEIENWPIGMSIASIDQTDRKSLWVIPSLKSNENLFGLYAEYHGSIIIR